MEPVLAQGGFVGFLTGAWVSILCFAVGFLAGTIIGPWLKRKFMKD